LASRSSLPGRTVRIRLRPQALIKQQTLRLAESESALSIGVLVLGNISV